MGRRFRVLQLQNSYNVNASDLAEQIIKSLPSERYDVTTAFLRGRPKQGEQVSCAPRSVYFEFEQSATKGLRLRALWKLYQHCREQRYDAVIVHRFKPINMLLLLNVWLKIPVCVGILHGIGEFDRSYRQWIIRCLLSGAWRFVGVSRAVRDDLLASCCDLTEENTLYINNAIDIDQAEAMQLSRDSARELLRLSSEDIVIGTIGRLVPVKGHVYLLHAFARIKDDFPLSRLVIIGDGRSRSELDTCIEMLQLQGRVYLPGALDDALQYLKAFNVFIMPSLREGLPLALLEGMSARLPVLGSDIDSLRPILQECGGRLFQPANVPTLTQELRTLLELSVEAREAEGLKAYEYLRQAHAIEGFHHQYLRLLDLLLGDQRRF